MFIRPWLDKRLDDGLVDFFIFEREHLRTDSEYVAALQRRNSGTVHWHRNCAQVRFDKAAQDLFLIARKCRQSLNTQLPSAIELLLLLALCFVLAMTFILSCNFAIALRCERTLDLRSNSDNHQRQRHQKDDTEPWPVFGCDLV
jgi:hypothetical protein